MLEKANTYVALSGMSTVETSKCHSTKPILVYARSAVVGCECEETI